MTERGWLSYSELREGDSALTLNNETGLSEWQPVLEVCVFDAKPRRMISIESRSHSSLTTPDHRWPVVRPSYLGSGSSGPATGEYRTWALSKDFKFEDGVPLAADCADLPTAAKHTDALVEAVGWFWTEGHIRKLRSGAPGRNVTISQAAKNVDTCAMIRSALTRLCGSPAGPFPNFGQRTTDGVPRWNEWTTAYGKTTFSLSADAGDLVRACAPGRVPTHAFLMELTKAQLELFLHVSMLADNCGKHVFAQKDRAAAEAFQFAAILAGYPTSSWIRAKGKNSHSPGLLMHHVRLRAQRFLWPGRPGVRADVEYDGVVWCPRTPNQTWLARRNGKVYFTGNTSWMRDLRIGKGRVIVPDVYLQSLGRGRGAYFDAEQEIFTQVNALPGAEGLAMQVVQFAIRVEEHERTCAALTAQALRGAGYSVQTFGEGGDVAATATEVHARERRSYTTRARKIEYWKPALGRLAETALAIDAKHFRTGIKPVRPDVEFPDGVTPDPEQLARTIQLLDSAKSVSTKTKVALLHPDWDDDRVEKEVDLIDKAGLPPVPPPGTAIAITEPGKPGFGQPAAGRPGAGASPVKPGMPAPNARRAVPAGPR